MWLPRKIPKNFLSRPFLCGICAAEAVESLKLADGGVANYSHLVEADCLEQYGRRENPRIFGVPEQEAEDPYEKVTIVQQCLASLYLKRTSAWFIGYRLWKLSPDLL